MIDDCGVVWSM